MNFHLYQDGIEVAEPPIYERDLKAYARDSKRSLKDRHERKYAWLKTIHNTITQWTVALTVGSLFASHCVYA